MKRSYTILYVDDDIDDLHLISDAFEKYTDHLAVVHASNGIQAFRVLDEMRATASMPCLVILDINMPVMDGKQTLQKLRDHAEYRDLPVVVFSTSQSQADREFARQYGADFVSKPTRYAELNSLVAEFVNKCRFEARKTA